MQRLLLHVFEQLDQELRVEELASLPAPRIFTIVGQMALFLADLPILVASTIDLDLLGLNYDRVFVQLDQSLMAIGLTLERDHRLIWMPPQTEYWSFYQGTHFEVRVAEALYVIASKCKFRREKDRRLIEEYFRYFPEAKSRIEKMGIDTIWLSTSIQS